MERPSNSAISVVICSIDARKFERVSENYRMLFAGRDIEIIGIHDARSLAEGYTRGIAQSRGARVILSHDDIEILTADQDLFQQQLLLAQVRGAELRARAELYRTLGGGWQP